MIEALEEWTQLPRQLGLMKNNVCMYQPRDLCLYLFKKGQCTFTFMLWILSKMKWFLLGPVKTVPLSFLKIGPVVFL